MARQPRQISPSGSYHVMFRGVSHCHIFEGKSDYLKLLEILKIVKAEMEFQIPAYCLLDNHVHLMLTEREPGLLPVFMKKVLVRYVRWFNQEYQRRGVLMENRYRSECVADEAYALALVRYIHLNPCVAGIVTAPGAYHWSSYRDYLTNSLGLSDTAMVLGMFSQDEKQARDGFVAFHELEPTVQVDIKGDDKPTEEQLREKMLRTVCAKATLPKIASLFEIATLDKQQRNAALATLRAHGFSIRQIERATGISRGIIANS